MKTTAILFLAYLALCVQCSVPENKSTKKEISTQPQHDAGDQRR